MENFIREVCQKEGLEAHSIQPLPGGQVNQVFRVDEQYVIRIGARDDAFQRLHSETELMRRLASEIPVPKIYAFGQQAGLVYQIQQYVRGQKLYSAWKDLRSGVQEQLVLELVSYLRKLHAARFPDFGYPHAAAHRLLSWPEFLAGQLTRTLQEFQDLKIQVAPGFLETASAYFEQHQGVLTDGVPALVHGDLWLGNILVENDRISAVLDFEYAVQAPRDYELLKIEDFCLYPNDYAEEANEIFCTADFASFCLLLRRHYPELFEVDHLRERLNIYHLVSTLSDYLEWRKSNLVSIPAERMAAKEFYMARISNIVFRNGTRMFIA